MKNRDHEITQKSNVSVQKDLKLIKVHKTHLPMETVKVPKLNGIRLDSYSFLKKNLILSNVFMLSD